MEITLIWSNGFMVGGLWAHGISMCRILLKGLSNSFYAACLWLVLVGLARPWPDWSRIIDLLVAVFPCIGFLG